MILRGLSLHVLIHPPIDLETDSFQFLAQRGHPRAAFLRSESGHGSSDKEAKSLRQRLKRRLDRWVRALQVESRLSLLRAMTLVAVLLEER